MPYPKPNMTWIGSPNYGLPRSTEGRGGNTVIAIVDHIMEGTLTGTDSWFQDPAAQASAHFGVGKNGEIHQYVDINNVAWANGVVNQPSWPLLDPNVNPNYYTVSIEHEGQSGDPFTEVQYQATLALHRWLIDTFGLQVNENTIIGHCRIDSVNRADCPGPAFPWQRLFSDLKGESELKLQTLVLYYGDADLQIAADLAQNFSCPIVQVACATPELLAAAETKYQVGGATAPAGVTLLSGADRFDTMKSVLKAMGKI
ncbi:MAG: N-acetylmuramoyl-L-alanine amidase [Desulfitobacteriaceae bacterium]